MTGSSAIAQSQTTLPASLSSKIQGNYFVYNGYRFDISQVLSDEHLEEILDQLEWQVYFITVLNLPQEIQDFFKSVPVFVAPQYQNNESTAEFITLLSGDLVQDQLNWISYKREHAGFLYKLLEDLLAERLPEGVNNSDVVKYFEQAKLLPCYQKKNPQWLSGSSSTDNIYFFFTNAAMAYLRGSYWDEPSSCYVIQKNQPEFFRYLENLFGPKSGFLTQCFSYHGFNFNWSQMDDFSHYTETCNECIRQVNYIEATGVSPTIMDFFKSVPLKLIATYEMPNNDLGVYFYDTQSISLNANDAATGFPYAGKSDVPVLHELLHAFHYQVLIDGPSNPYISQFFKQAQQMHCYDNTNDISLHLNYLMSNECEFFACTATAFLGNYTPDEPFNRRRICQYQPDYYLYLQGIFGTNHDDIDIIERSLLSNAIDHLY